MGLPAIAIDRHLEQIHLFESDLGSLTSRMLMERPGDDPAVQNAQYWTSFGAEVGRLLGRAPTYAVTDLMLNVIKHGAETIGNPPLRFDENMPSLSGFAWFERPQPWLVISPDGSDHPPVVKEVHGVWWLPSGKVQFGSEMVEGMVSGVVVAREDMFTNMSDVSDDPIATAIHMGFPPYLTFDVTGWAANKPWVEINSEDSRREEFPDHSEVSPTGAYWRRWLYAFWALCEQRIQVVPADRHARKRAERGFPSGAPNYGDVRVLSLRRLSPRRNDGDGDPYEWSHRWMVNGHWRWQACGAGRAERKLIWIEPFVKGPEDKPLVIRDDVRLLRR